MAVLKEYGLTAKCFLERFKTLRKPFNDTFILFTSKLRGLLLQYFNARNVTSFDDVSLLVSDRVKSSLTEQCFKYVLSVENNLPSDGQQWLEPQRLSEIVDEYVRTQMYLVRGPLLEVKRQCRMCVISHASIVRLSLRAKLVALHLAVFIVMAVATVVKVRHRVKRQQ